MKKFLLPLLGLLLLLPAALFALQDTPAPSTARLELTGIDPVAMPEIIVTANVYGPSGQPVQGLTVENFRVTGDLAEQATVVSVENVTDDNIPFSVVLVIDVSDSMEGLPLRKAKEAAQAFIDNLRPNTQVAVYSFASGYTLVQNFTNDPALLTAAIAELRLGGRTGLYQAAYNAVDLAANAPTDRHVVVLLSDGAEYGGVSMVPREAALTEAQAQGVSVYTIGLGFGIDRSYLQQLSEGTNALNYESPTPEELNEIFTRLADLLSSQYVITLDLTLPADGQTYDLGLEVDTPFGTASTVGQMRAPIPVPIVSLPAYEQAITEPTVISPNILADDNITEARFRIDDGEVVTAYELPYSITLDPTLFVPGEYTLSVEVADVDGDVGSAETRFEVGALAPIVNVVSNLGAGPIDAPQSVILEVTGQTPGVSATYRVDELRTFTSDVIPFLYEVDPRTLIPGPHTLFITVTNEGGGTTTVEQPFEVVNLGPYVVISGLEEGQVVDAETRVDVNVILTQSPIDVIEVALNGQPLTNNLVPESGAIMSFTTVDPRLFEPGPAVLTAHVVNATGGEADLTINFEIAPLPPMILFDNLTEGQTLDSDMTVEVSFLSQTPVVHVAYLFDGVDAGHLMAQPWLLNINTLDLGPGEHTLRVVADNQGGESTTAEINFIISDAPGLTATANAPTATPTATPNLDATATEAASMTQAVVDRRATGTAAAQANATDQAQVQVNASATADAIQTQSAQVELNAAGTAMIQSTRDTRATNSAELRATTAIRTTQEAIDSRATVTAGAATQQSALAGATLEAESTTNAAQAATLDAGATLTADAVNASATARADRASTAEARDALQTATVEAGQTQQAVAEINAQGTANAQATRDARATASADRQATNAAVEVMTLDAAASQTADAVNTATGEAVNATLDAAATEAASDNATATERAIQVATRDAQATLDTQATRDTQLAAIGATEETPTDEPTIVAQDVTLTAQPRQSPTPPGTLVPIELEGQAADPLTTSLPLIGGICAVFALLLVVFLLARRGRVRSGQ